MSRKVIIALSGYIDGKHETLPAFNLSFPEEINRYARQNNLNIESRLIGLVGCDEVARKKDLHTNYRPFDIREIVEWDTIVDRIGTMVPTGGILLDKAVYTGCQVFNRPISIDESKARDYMIASMFGFLVPRTVVLPQGSYIRARMAGGDEHAIELDIDLDEAVRWVGGYPCYFKKANGGGRAHVYRVKNKAELFEMYQMTREHLMILQESIDIEKYIRTFCFGTKVAHTCYDVEKPDGQKYSWPDGILNEEERTYLDNVMPALAGALGTPFCTMEITKNRRDGRWYFIDITNGCNFDMREGELSSPIFHVAKTLLLDEVVNWSLNPRPMIVHSNLQEYVLRQQLCRGCFKHQNLDHLLNFARARGYSLDDQSLHEEIRHFEERYSRIYGG